MKLNDSLLVVLFMISLGTAVGAADVAQEERDFQPKQEMLYTSSVIGETVENENGEKIGTIRELVFNPETGKIELAIVSVNAGFLGSGAKPIVIPWNQFRLSATKRGYRLGVRRQTVSDESAQKPRRGEERESKRTAASIPAKSDNRPAVETSALKHFSGTITDVDSVTRKIQVRRGLNTHTFNCGISPVVEWNRLQVGADVEVDYRDQSGLNMVETVRPVAK